MKRIAIDFQGLLPQERLTTATVRDVDDAGVVRIAYAEDAPPIVAAIGMPLGGTVRVGDDVVVLLRDGDETRPVIVSTISERLAQETIKLKADRELVLECGEASISLHADGRIVVHGGYIETYAEGTNRIKGAQVRIN
jgi:hypothetical protein